MAHELGHYYLEEHRRYLINGGTAHCSNGEFVTNNLIELEADCFAAGLLTPKKLLSPYLNKGILSFQKICAWAEIFNVSVVSMAVSCIQMSDFPCAIVAFKDGKIKWECISESLFEAGCYPNYAALPYTARAAWSEFTASGNHPTEKKSCKVDQWFNTYGNSRVGNAYFEESYFSIPVMGTLLVLLTADESDL